MLAHIDESTGRTQTVAAHCQSTAEKAAFWSSGFHMSGTGRLLGLLHDIGKLCEDFQSYLQGKGGFRRGDIDHCYAGARYLCEIADQIGETCYRVSRFMAHCILSHHGLHDWFDEQSRDYCQLRIEKSERYQEICARIGQVAESERFHDLLFMAAEEYRDASEQIAVLCRATSTEKKSQATARAFYWGMLERLMLSVLMDADRTDTSDFMLQTQTDRSLKDKDLQALWMRMEQRLSERLGSFSDRMDPISRQRQSISERCAAFADHPAGIVQMIVPTGGGKTLSAMRYGISLCRRYQKQKIFYVAPFMSILEQNSREIRSLTGETYFLEHHSNMLAEQMEDSDRMEYRLHTETWDSPVIATTMVQFLNALFSGTTGAVRRMHRMSQSVIVIDEVQSVPLNCVYLFDLAVNFLAKFCGCTVILCSATQPVFQKQKYPILLDDPASITGDHRLDFEVFRRTRVIPPPDTPLSNADAAEFCIRQLAECGSVLMVVNTKKEALSLCQLLKEHSGRGDCVLMHLSTNMCPKHRTDQLEQIRSLLKQRVPMICVTTQLIEAGVDISFRCVIRSLAGLDSITQAAGRCNRNGEAREPCPVYVLELQEENLGRLPEIQRSAKCAWQILRDGRPRDITSVEAMQQYYELLFRESEKLLSYPVMDPETSLLNLLSLNQDWHRKSVVQGYRTENLNLAQAFRTAGEKFTVIGSQTTGILVPYGSEGKRLIASLSSDLSYEEMIRLLRAAQSYSVNVYSYTLEKLLNEEALLVLPCGAYGLKDSYYHVEYGINCEGGMLEMMMY